VCDGLDNDCDGAVDEEATCPDGKKCYQGVCVGSCETSQEFACQLGYECDKALSLCVDTKCKGKLCGAGEICRGGLCGNGCDGVVCPGEQVCQGGLCVDLCANHPCATGEVCKWGVCIPGCLSCGGLECALGLSCDKATNNCYDASCTTACPSGTVCKQGKCVDLCDGVVCPGGVACEKGACPPPGIGKAKPPTDGSQPGLDGGAGDARADGGKGGFTSDKGCNCELAASSGAELAWPMLLLLVAILHRRRR
jgi:MYXO-CTERM domain-containing protein